MATEPGTPHWLVPAEVKRVLDEGHHGRTVLLWRDPDGMLQIQPLDVAEPTYLGRGAQMDVPLTGDDKVSGLHARIAYAAGEWLLEDENWSKNGTYLNERKIDRILDAYFARHKIAAPPLDPSKVQPPTGQDMPRLPVIVIGLKVPGSMITMFLGDTLSAAASVWQGLPENAQLLAVWLSLPLLGPT